MENFELIIKKQIPVIRIFSRLDASSSIALDSFLKPHLESHQQLIMDFSACPYMSSAGIRVVLKTHKNLIARQGKFILAGLKPEVFQVLEMTGMHQILEIVSDSESALEELLSPTESALKRSKMDVDGHEAKLSIYKQPEASRAFFIHDEVLSYQQAGFAVGMGISAETITEKEVSPELFFSCGMFSGFLPTNSLNEPDFRVPAQPEKTSLTIIEGVLFEEEPDSHIDLSNIPAISLERLSDMVQALKNQTQIGAGQPVLMVTLDQNPAQRTLSFGLIINASWKSKLGFPDSEVAPLNNQMWLAGGTIVLEELPDKSKSDVSIREILGQVLTLENILGVKHLNIEAQLIQPQCWLFVPNKTVNGSLGLKIETSAEQPFESYKRFLARNLYTDSAKIQIKQLHGGFSAQTFQVISFDSEGRKMRPTVLKMANKSIISREAERCEKYALPYIFNNSAVVLGAEFYGDFGALRYNFVGIGGEKSQLKWLTHYYENQSFEKLEPLFDKIFLQILEPWYGQAVAQDIYPFRDHDPTLTFFPHIYNTVQDLFRISSDDKFITIPELQRKILNPYWFLKHEFVRRRDNKISYYSSVCHGDLNMQNILLDENMNVYLIDFSETRPRSVVSDFARLEAIFMVDKAPVSTDEDMQSYLQIIQQHFSSASLNQQSTAAYKGEHLEIVGKNLKLSKKMREYAYLSANHNPDPVPYYLALLEWVLPIVCYTLPLPQRRLSLIVSALLCERIIEND